MPDIPIDYRPYGIWTPTPWTLPEEFGALGEHSPQDPRDVTNHDDAGYNPASEGLQDFYPQDEEQHAIMVSWAYDAFLAAERARMPFFDRWLRYYRLYRNYVQRVVGDWRSKVFYPVSYWVVATIMPKLLTNRPTPRVKPVTPFDVPAARAMEELLDWSMEESDFYPEWVKSTWESLVYGTGILKIYQRQDIRYKTEKIPVQEPVTQKMSVPYIDPDSGAVLTDPDGTVVYGEEDQVLGYQDVGFNFEQVPYVVYDGPAAEAVDIMNFFVAPEADDVQSARYVIHRTYREMAYVLKRVEEGVFRLPPNMSVTDLAYIRDDPMALRLGEIGLDGGILNDPTRRPVELLEFWTDDGRVITMANRKAILRAHSNPFTHGMKPFVRIVDNLVPHEFWGQGEIETIEGLQDLTNALVNQRVDNVKITMNATWAVREQSIFDLRDLASKPGQVIRVKGDVPLQDAVARLPVGDVTSSAFAEAQQTENFIERTTGVSAYQLGTDSPTLNQTATGVNLIQHAGFDRFSLKTRLGEMMGMKQVFRMYGALLQQFAPPQRLVRILGPDGGYLFQSFRPEDIEGALAYDIEAGATNQTEQERRQDAMQLLQLVGTVMPPAIPHLVENVLRAFGIKNITDFVPGQLLQMPPGAAMTPGLPPGGPGSIATPPGTPTTMTPGGPQPAAGALPSIQPPQPIQPRLNMQLG